MVTIFPNMDSVMKCKICNKNLGIITNSHLKKHGLTTKQYSKRFKCKTRDRKWLGVKPAERFLDNIKKVSSGCWEWQLSTGTNGYGSIGVNGKIIGTHCFSYSYFREPVPKGMCVLHECDNRSCCNPYHLFLGTHQDNVKDREAKGRGRWRGVQGEDCPAAKLTWKKVRRIRERLSNGETTKKLAKDYGMSPNAISKIRENRSWIDKEYVRPDKDTVWYRGNAKLDWEKVRQIRAQHNGKPADTKRLARLFRVSVRAIRSVLNNTAWNEKGRTYE